MSQSPEPNQISALNELSISTLARAISYSQGEFSLILVRCNYAALRQSMMRQLRQKCSLEIQEIELLPTSKTLYTAISDAIGNEHPQALAVFGLESVQEIDAVLASTNQVREEFRKSFAFPLVLWINDNILRKLIKQVPDLESWASVIEFEIPPDDLKAFLQETADVIFEEYLEEGAVPFLNKRSRELSGDSLLGSELRLAQREVEHNAVELKPELAASLEFLIGLATAGSMQESRHHCEQSLSLWPSDIQSERRGCINYQLGLWWRTYAVQHRSDYDTACEKAINYYQQAIDTFAMIDRSDLTAKFIEPLAEALQRLQQWEKLESLAQTLLTLNKTSDDLYRQASGHGFIAEAAIGHLAWNRAKEAVEQALQLLDMAIAGEPEQLSEERRAYINWQTTFRRGWYLFALGRAQWHLEQHQDAIDTLELARTTTRPEYDPPLFIQILRTLRQYYFEQKEYLKAFDIRLEYRSLEQQYGFRAFVGAGRLQAQREVLNPALVNVQSKLKSKVSQEIAASGRQESVNRLIDRISRPDQKLIVLHGQSGVGKSSIIQAGLIPSLDPITLDTREVITVLQQVYTNWTEHLGREMLKAFERTGFPRLSEALESPYVMLEQLRKSVDQENSMVVLIFDQFEEFFFVHKEPSDRKPFYSFLKQCLDIPYVKVILSLREDYLHYLLECNDRLVDLDVINNNILDKGILFYLGNFSRQEAKSVFQRLTRDTPYPLSPELTEELVQDLSEELGEIRPIELQVVGSQLQTEQITTLEAYREKGPKDELVSRFLDEVTHDCGPENEDIARLVLYLLTDENNTRPLKTREDIELEVNVSDKLDLILTILVKSGLVFRIPSSPSDRYQLVHDYLVIFVRQGQSTKLIAELEKEREQRQLTEKQLNEALQKQLRTARRATFTLAGLATAITGFAILASLALINNSISSQNANSRNNQHLDRIISSVKSGKFLHRWSMGVIPEIRLTTLSELSTAINSTYLSNRVNAHEDDITSIDISPDGQYVASSSKDGKVGIWRIDGSLITYLTHSSEVNVVRFHPDSSKVVTGDDSGEMKLWDINNFEILVASSEHSEGINDIQFSPDGELFASSSEDATVRLWSGKTGDMLGVFAKHNTGVDGIRFSHNGRLIASFSEFDSVRIWDTNNLQQEQVLEDTYKTINVEFINGSEELLVVTKNSTQSVYSTSGGEVSRSYIETYNYPPRIEFYERLPSRREIAFLTEKAESKSIYFSISRPSYLSQRSEINHEEEIVTFDISPDGENLVSATESNHLLFWKSEPIFSQLKDVQDSPINKNLEGIHLANIAMPGEDFTLAYLDEDHSDTSNHAHIKYSTESIPIDGAFSLSPQGSIIAGVSSHNADTVWDLNGRAYNLSGSDTPITAASFVGPEKQKIVTGSLDGSVTILDSEQKLPKILDSHEGPVIETASSLNGKIFISMDSQTIKVWDYSGSLLKSINSNKSNVAWREVVISPNGDFFIATDSQGNATIWSMNSGVSELINAHIDPVYRVRISPDGSKFMTASFNRFGGNVKVWSKDGSPLGSFFIDYGRINFTPDSQGLLFSNFRGLRILDWDGSTARTFSGHVGEVIDLAFSSDGSRIVTSGEDSTVRLWTLDNTDTSQILRGHDSSVVSVSFSPDNQKIASLDDEGFVKIWEPTTGENIATFEKNSSINSLQFSPNGKSLILSSQGVYSSDSRTEKVIIVDLDGNELYRFWGRDISDSLNFFAPVPGNALISQESKLNLWNSTGGLITVFYGHTDEINGVSFSPSGDTLASASSDKSVKLWKIGEDEPFKTLQHDEKVNSVSFSKSGQLLATASDDEIVRIWSISGELVKELDKHADEVTSVLFSPDGKHLASSSADGAVRLWNVENWTIDNEFTVGSEVNTSELDALSFSKDSNLLAYGTGEQVYVRFLNRRLFGGIWFKGGYFHPVKSIPESALLDRQDWIVVKGNKGPLILSLGLTHSIEQSCAWISNHLKANDNEQDDNLCSQFESLESK